MLPQWQLEPEQIKLAEDKGFKYELNSQQRFMLKRDKDHARIWPHVDGFIFAFIRSGEYVKHKKYCDLDRALDRQFGDKDYE